MNIRLDKIGSIVIFITVMLSPCCFLLVAFALSALGLGGVTTFEWTNYLGSKLVYEAIEALLNRRKNIMVGLKKNEIHFIAIHKIKRHLDINNSIFKNDFYIN